MSKNKPVTAVDYALDLLKDGQVVGLGTGRAATAFVNGLGQRVRDGLWIRGVATSEETEKLARRLNIPLTTLNDVEALDLTVDGADEVDPALNLIKGYGGALVREKVVASASRKLIIIVGPEKLVPILGSRGILPVEVVPFAHAFCHRELAKLKLKSTLRRKGSKAFVSNNGNHVLDCKVSTLRAPVELEQKILNIPGVVGTGLFLGMADIVLVQREDHCEVRKRKV